jgi:Glu-tRNA(Gln) amidotransferase subunit E-like FAD-binding protein
MLSSEQGMICDCHSALHVEEFLHP